MNRNIRVSAVAVSFVCVFTCTWCLLTPRANAAEKGLEETPRDEMHRVFSALAVLLPLSLDSETFALAANQEEIARQVAILLGAVHAFEAHGERRDVGFRFLSRSLANDVEEIHHRLQWGRHDEARYFVLDATRNCVACHSRLPSAREFPLGDELLRRVDFSDLSYHERGQILVATRQFDRAMSSWEELFLGSSMPPSQLHLGGYLNDYLVIALRVQNEPGRALRTLEKLAKKPDTPAYLRLRLETWVEELRSLRPSSAVPPKLGEARALVRKQRPPRDLPDDQASAVTDLIASSMLLTYIDGAQKRGISDAQLAEAFYLLGVVEARGVDSFWVPQAEFHLEAAIRIDPKGPYAQSAFELLEQTLSVGFGGTSAEILPTDLWTNLNELRGIATGESPLEAPEMPN